MDPRALTQQRLDELRALAEHIRLEHAALAADHLPVAARTEAKPEPALALLPTPCAGDREAVEAA